MGIPQNFIFLHCTNDDLHRTNINQDFRFFSYNIARDCNIDTSAFLFSFSYVSSSAYSYYGDYCYLLLYIVAARVTVSVRRVYLQFSSAYPGVGLFRFCHARLLQRTPTDG